MFLYYTIKGLANFARPFIVYKICFVAFAGHIFGVNISCVQFARYSFGINISCVRFTRYSFGVNISCVDTIGSAKSAIS